MMGLPEFGLYTKSDQQLSPKSIQEKLDQFGLKKTKVKPSESLDNTPFMQAN